MNAAPQILATLMERVGLSNESNEPHSLLAI